MRRRWLAFLCAGLLAVSMLLGGSGIAVAATGGVGTISGTTDQGTRIDGIQILGYSQNVTTAREAGSGLATGRRQYQPLLIRKRIDKSSPLLMRAMGRGEVFPSLRIAITETGQAGSGGGKGSTMTITLTNAQIVAVTHGDCDDDCDGVMESVSFIATKIEWSADGVTWSDDWSTTETGTAGAAAPTYFMAINEKGVPSRPKKQTKASAYRTQIISPRDSQSGLPTGKRQHSPFLLTIPDATEAPELLASFLSGRPIDLIALITYGPDGQAKGAINLEGVQVLSMTDTRVWGDPHVDQRGNPLYQGNGTSGTNPLFEASGSNVRFELRYNKIKWLDAAGNVTHEDSWDTQR